MFWNFYKKNKFLKKLKCFKKSGENLKFSKKKPPFWNSRTQKYKVSGTNLKLFQYLSSSKINVNPTGY